MRQSKIATYPGREVTIGRSCYVREDYGLDVVAVGLGLLAHECHVLKVRRRPVEFQRRKLTQLFTFACDVLAHCGACVRDERDDMDMLPCEMQFWMVRLLPR